MQKLFNFEIKLALFMDAIAAVNNLEYDLSVLKGADVETAKSAAPGLIKAAKILSSVSPEESTKLVEMFQRLYYEFKPEEAEYLPIFAEEAMKIVKSIQQKIEIEAVSPYLKFSRVITNPKYDKACEVYASYKEQIVQTENKIMKSTSYQKKLHEELKHGNYAGCLHARVTGNLRIIYKVEKQTKILVFLDIITHDELDKI